VGDEVIELEFTVDDPGVQVATLARTLEFEVPSTASGRSGWRATPSGPSSDRDGPKIGDRAAAVPEYGNRHYAVSVGV